ncbi:MAG: iron donor protein CyaY [Acidobacteria bacterium]|nr:iron donor protein CyaY [Acidobacteriota bacterium]
MDEQEFRRQADQALDQLFRKLTSAGDQYGFEADFNAGALTIEFDEPPGKFVVSPNTPVRQIWVSAHSRSFKLDWDAVRAAFVYPETGDTLLDMIASAISKQLGEEVRL